MYDLPIAPNPAVLALGVAQVLLGKLVDELNVTGQPDTDMRAFDQVMAQQASFGKPPREHPAEGAHIVDALAVVGPFTREVLVDIGNRAGVRINSPSCSRPTDTDGCDDISCCYGYFSGSHPSFFGSFPAEHFICCSFEDP